MAWLIVRVFDDRQGINTTDILKRPGVRLGDPNASDVAALVAEYTDAEVHTSFEPTLRREWPWSVVAYTSRRKDGIGRLVGLHIHLPARPKRKAAS
jgi:hypothetical protein